MQVNARALIAALLGPLFPALFFIILITLTDANKAGLSIPIFISVFFAYLGFFIFGLPSILVLQRKEKLTIVNLTACATVSGVMVYGVFLWLLSLVMGVNLSFDIVKTLWIGAFFGGGIAIAYGLIAGVDFK
ncbi:hypothetical protein HS961_01400 [Comamonas piscis]|uniref:Uncharacterized protein n=1 Tax=Comamonas piscis TaxID=1562974 RepID=A0A7G5EC71_9BURK|nr:hypothetical protein [Comamonas piscis]QMV71596.1 hypothetical protein HS961_01400 [Comamonas piscis]WSO34314.1 hypothetical protein VUJ63_01405 [Comamonas piscis]